MMITKQHLEFLRANQQKPNFGSEAKSMFINGQFNPENWNGGDDIIRQFSGTVEYKWDENTKCYEIDWMKNEHEHSGDVIVQYVHYQDHNYVTILVRGYDNDESDSDWYLDQYVVQYYKNRGKTERVLYNGKLISEEDYIVLCNIIESIGFKFTLE